MSEYRPGDVGLHMAEKWQTGAGFFDAAVSLNEAVKENDKVAVGIGSAGIALETLGLVLDPIGSLLTAGIGWLIEHISVLRWPLDIMWGDPEGIQAAEEAVKAEKAKLEQWAQDHQAKLATLMESWSGEGADQFRKSMEAVTDQLNAIGGYLENAGKSMKVAGGLVGAFRGIARDLIAMLLATIIKGALIAAALAPVTFGASIAVFIGTTIGMVATALGKIGAKIAELTRKLVDLGASLGKLGKAGDDLAGAKPPSVKPGSSGPAPVNTGAQVSTGPKLNEPPASVAAGPKPADVPAVSPPPKVDDAVTTQSASPKPADPPPASPGPKPNEPADQAPPKPTDQAQPGPSNQQPGHPVPDPKTHHRLSEQMAQAIKNELSKIEGVTPATLEKFDKISNFSVAQLGKLFGPAGAEKFEQAIKYMTDPWFGYRGLAGKTIIDMIKGIPTSVGNVTGGDDE